MPLTSAQDFRDAAAKRRKTVDVEIDGLGTVRLRALSAGDAQQFQTDVRKAKADGKNEEELAFSLIARSWIDDAGQLLFPPDEKGELTEGIAVAKSLDPTDYNIVATAVLRLNGLSAEAVKDAEGFSSASPNGSSPTDSRNSLVLQTSI
jgi:hypothetical protein